MFNAFKKFLASKRIVTKGLVIMALFGMLTSGVFSPVALNGEHPITSIPVAHADACAVAEALSVFFLPTNAISRTAQVGDTVTYELVGAPAFTTPTQVNVTDVMPSGLIFVSASTSNGTYSNSGATWNPGTLNNGSEITLDLTTKVSSGTEGQAITIAPTITYSQTGCAPSSATSSAVINVQAATTPTSTPAVADIAINKIADVTSTTEGSTVHYTITATDNGPATSTDVVATDTLPTGLTFVSATFSEGSYASSTGSWNVGTLSASSSATLDIAATVNKGTASTTIKNTAFITESSTENDPKLSNNSSSVSIVVGNPIGSSCSLATALVTTVSDKTPAAGETITYTLTGAPAFTVAKSLTIQDVLGAGLTFVSASTSNGFYASSTGTWNVGTLPSGNSVITLVLTATVNADAAGQTIDNTPSIAYGANTCADSSKITGASITVQGATITTSTPEFADIAIAKTVDNANPAVNQTVNYTLVVTDNGPATSTDVVATDTLPSTLTFVSATFSEGSYASSTGSWTIGTVDASSTATLTITARVNSGTAGATITNTGFVSESASTTDSKLANNSSSVAIVVQGGGGGGGNDAGLTITKTVDATSTLPGNTIHYTIIAIANGPQPSTGVVATDTLPTGITFKNATTTVGTSTYATSTRTETWTIGTLAPNATATLEIAALVNASDTVGQMITNDVVIGESPTLTNTNPVNTAEATTTVAAATSTPSTGTDLAIDKTVDNASPVTGTNVNFTILVTNSSTVSSTFVQVQDQLPIGLALISATTTLPSTTYDMSTGIWYIGTMSPDATATMTIAAEVSAAAGTQVTNTATVTSTLSSFVDINPANNSSSVTLNVQAAPCTSNCGGGGGGGGGGGNTPSAQIAIVKTVDNADPATGSIVHYTLTVSAEGPTESFGVVASDTLPAGVTFDSASSSEGSYVNSTGIWTIGNMAEGQTATLVITATVTAPNGTVITNTGTVHESPTVISPLTGPMTSSVTIDVGGTGGGGGGGGNGGGGGQVLGASTSTGQVLGASCGLYLTSYIHPIRKNLNDPTEVKKLQTFLNQNLGLELPVTGYYGDSTIAAVNQFQVKYHIEVLKPWLPLGLPTQFTPTSYVYQTTQRWINLIMCPPLNLPVPALKVDNSE